MEGQRGPKLGFPTLRCDAPEGGWRCDAATLRRSGGQVALRRCDAARGWRRSDAVTLRRCRWASDAAALSTLLTLRRYDAAKLGRRCGAFGAVDAATRQRPCDAVDAATLRRRIGAATLLALRGFLLE